MIFRFLFYIFLFYLAYKLLFELVIPLFRTTRKIKKGIREMQERMNQQAGTPPTGSTRRTEPAPDKTRSADYIDFEEIK
jgi:hypothetical protein